MKRRGVSFAVISAALAMSGYAMADEPPLWKLYDETLKSAKYIDLTHAFAPVQPVWPGFGPAKFKPAIAGQDIEGYIQKGQEFTYDKHGFVATAYDLTTDQYGTQLDPPSHWNPLGATISDLPATYAVRPLVVIDISGKVATDQGYHLQVADVEAWEKKHGRIPEGSVVFVRSDCTQAEGVANLDKVPEAGALVTIGFAKPLGGSGGYARYVAIAPADWTEGVSVKDTPGAPLPQQKAPLKRDENGVFRPTP